MPFLRFPSVRNELVAVVAEDDIWLGTTDGGRAHRLTADRAPVAHTRLAPDGTLVAYTSRRDGAPEVHVVPVDGGPARRLTHWGSDFTRVLGWTDDGRVLAASAVGAPFRSRTWAYAVPVDGGPPQRLPYGPVNAVAAGGPAGAVVVGTAGNRRGAAAWKRYRGGTSGRLWLDPDGSGDFAPFQERINGQLEDPHWVGDRLVFLSDHKGYGNVYSCRADGGDLRRHSDHDDFYARAAHSDGTSVVYQCAGSIWLIPELSPDAEPEPLEIVLAGPRTGLATYLVDATQRVETVSPDHTGRASALEVRGTVQWVAHRDGPAVEVAGGSAVRHRLPLPLGRPAEDGPQTLAWITDADGADAVEIGAVDGSSDVRRLAGGDLGRVLDLAAAPDGRWLAAAAHDGRVLLVEVDSGAVRELDRADGGDASGLAFSPDSAWLAWSHPGPEPLRHIKLARVDGQPVDGADSPVVDATPLRFTDTEPVFTPDGKHLAFFSVRTLDPVYDALVFDLSFVSGTRPYLLPLDRRTPSPFDPSPGGRAMSAEPDKDTGKNKDKPAEKDTPPTVTVDLEGLHQRLVPVPVPGGYYSALGAARDGLVWLQDPMVGVLGDGLARIDQRPRSAVQRYDFPTRKLSTLVDKADSLALSGDGAWIVVGDEGALRVLPADRKASEDEDADDRAELDLAAVRVAVDPAAEWRQMYEENGRLMRDHFWLADLGGVDYDAALERYRPLLAEVATRDDLSEVLWEIQGELGSSHAYETPPTRPVEAARRLGLLGADLAPAPEGADGWVVQRVVPGESSAPAARSPLSAPGVGVRAGDRIVAVGGRPVDQVAGPGPLLVGTADKPTALTVIAADGERRSVVVVPLAAEMPLRYQDWVAGRRAFVHDRSVGRAGYLHIPDMVANGWAQFHRDLRVELQRDCLVVDVRDNNGGHVSSLVLEKLARTVQGWATVRHTSAIAYPEDARRGPLVCVTNEHAGSDGDIVTAMIKQMALGPVLGMRTWGGVIGIDGRYSLVDGTDVTQPRYSFWFGDTGWGVENYGVDPDIEVRFPPQAWAADEDPQLAAAVDLAVQRLATEPAAHPPSTADRPDRAAPTLPPRP